MNIKLAVEQLNISGIAASEEDVLRWIDEGKIKAEIPQRRNAAYNINPKDLTEFIIQHHTERLNEQLEKSKQENRKLSDELELTKTRIHIEQSKVRTLKKMLNAQIEAAGTNSFHYEEMLGLNADSNGQALKKEFKKLLKALHPDRGGDERLFRVFNEHYENLK
ncbi:MAG: J domain-containing protein [Mesobacillus sp.]|uniref:J domain-containing protein n=1 Tax=Mesobacillus sp. TaxID=2675271 RepID=UPI003C328AA0